MLFAAPPPPFVQAEGPRESLEAFLARARERQAGLFVRLGAELEAIVQRIEAMNLPASREAREAMIAECIALGPEATPLFLRWLDAGDAALDKERYRAGLLAQALSRMDTRAATGGLLELLARGSADGRLCAVRVLETSSEPDRVRPVLLETYRKSQGQLRSGLLRALLRQSTDDSAVLDEVLAGDDAGLREVALTVLAETKDAAALSRVQAMCADPSRAVEHAQSILAYFLAVPDAVGPPQWKDLIGLAANTRVPAATRLSILDALPQFVDATSNELRKAMDVIVTGSDGKLAEAARIVLARLGDKLAKRELLKPYDEVIENSPKWSQGYARRGEILRRIGEHREAEREFSKALSMGTNEPNSQPDTWVNAARNMAAMGKFKEAAGYLERAPISLARLQELANDPDFAKLRASKYGEVFRLP